MGRATYSVNRPLAYPIYTPMAMLWEAAWLVNCQAFMKFNCLISLVAAILLTVVDAGAQVASQVVQLTTGWNAVHVEVTPTGSVGEIFAGAPVDLVTTFYPEKQRVAALQDPAAEIWKNPEWRTWQPAGRPGYFLNNLYALEGGRAYLIRATAAATVTLSGTPATARLRWQAQSFNLTGLPVDPESPATFAGFFANSPAHQPLRAYRLVAGKWQPVSSSSAISPGVAYWIWCGEGSEFQGPLDVRTAGAAMIGEAGQSFTIGLLGKSTSLLTARITASGTLPLSIAPRDGSAEATLLGSSAASVPAGSGEALEYRFSSQGTAVAGASSVLTFRAAGVRLTVPVTTRGL